MVSLQTSTGKMRTEICTGDSENTRFACNKSSSENNEKLTDSSIFPEMGYFKQVHPRFPTDPILESQASPL